MPRHLDMNVLGIRRDKAKSVEHVDSMHGMDELHHVLTRSDYVVLATPNTAETFQYFGKPELGYEVIWLPDEYCPRQFD